MVSTPGLGVAAVTGPLAAAVDAYDDALTEAGDSEHATCRWCAMEAAVNAALQVVLDGRVVYSPRELNRLISAAIAAQLRERADTHVSAAEDPALPAFEREWHASEAVELDRLADHELGGGEV
jgi:hypothetical protein